MVTACLILLVVIAFYGYKAYVTHAQEKIERLQAMNEEAQRRQIQEAQAKAEEAQQRQFELSYWKKERVDGPKHVELVLSYPQMRLTIHVRHRGDDGFLADMYSLQSDMWKTDHEWLESDGWTKEEWMKHEIREFDVRRLQDGTWEHRLTRKRWRARVREALITELPYFEEDFIELTTLTRKEWKERGDYDNDAFRPWTKLTDYSPAIETGYQRFIHNR